MDIREVFISRGVIFHETHFPFHSPIIFEGIFLASKDLGGIDLSDELRPFVHHTQPNSTSQPTSRPTVDVQHNTQLTVEEFSTSSIQSPSQDGADTLPTPRRTSRPHHQPTYLKDYVCSQAVSNYALPAQSHWCNLVAFSQLPPQHQVHLSQLSTILEPNSYAEASRNQGWLEAMNKECPRGK